MRWVATLREQQSEAVKLDAGIAANLRELGYGGVSGRSSRLVSYVDWARSCFLGNIIVSAWWKVMADSEY